MYLACVYISYVICAIMYSYIIYNILSDIILHKYVTCMCMRAHIMSMIVYVCVSSMYIAMLSTRRNQLATGRNTLYIPTSNNCIRLFLSRPLPDSKPSTFPSEHSRNLLSCSPGICQAGITLRCSDLSCSPNLLWWLVLYFILRGFVVLFLTSFPPYVFRTPGSVHSKAFG